MKSNWLEFSRKIYPILNFDYDSRKIYYQKLERNGGEKKTTFTETCFIDMPEWLENKATFKFIRISEYCDLDEVNEWRYRYITTEYELMVEKDDCKWRD